MHYGEMPRATLGSSDLWSQVAIFGEWNIYGTRKKSFVKFQTSNAYLKKTFSWQKAEKGVKWLSVTGSHLWRMKYLRYSKKIFVKFQTSNAYLKKKRSADKKLKNNKKQTVPKIIDIQWNKGRNKIGTIRTWRHFILSFIHQRQVSMFCLTFQWYDVMTT